MRDVIFERLKGLRYYLLILLLSLLSIISLKNELDNNIVSMHSDEIHTLLWGTTHSIRDVPALRVGESTRWLARVFSPLGKYYMTTKMGGEHHITGWYYAGGYYLDKKFTSTDISNDPNIQDYVFFMRLLLGATVIVSFTLVSFSLITHKSVLSAVLYSTLPFLSTLLWDALGIFYTESALILAFNFIVYLYFSIKNITRLYFWSAFLLVFSLSTKITGVLFFIPIVIMLYKRDRLGVTSISWKGVIKVEGFILLSLIMFTLWNISSGSYGRWVDAMISNVYHFKTGHLVTDTTEQWEKTLSLLFPWLVFFVISILFIFISEDEDKIFLLSVGTVFILMVLSLVDVAWLLERNYTTATIISIFIISVGFGRWIERKFLNTKVLLKSIILFISISYLSILLDKFQTVSPESLLSSLKNDSCNKVAGIGVSPFDGFNFETLDSMPKVFTLKNEKDRLISTLSDYDCLVIYRTGNNKHYTNYLASFEFNLIDRVGDYFLFYNKN